MSADEAPTDDAPAPGATGMEIGAPPPTLPATPPVEAGIEIAGSEMPPGMPLGAAIAGAPIPMTAAITAVRDAIATEFCTVRVYTQPLQLRTAIGGTIGGVSNPFTREAFL
jgi:hypothetical protein